MSTVDVAERFVVVVEAVTTDPRARVAPPGRGFGSAALMTGKKIFAVVSSRGEYVVKLPAARVQELVRQGVGHPFEPGMGRRMKEWLAVEPEAPADWVGLAREALDFVSAAA